MSLFNKPTTKVINRGSPFIDAARQALHETGKQGKSLAEFTLDRPDKLTGSVNSYSFLDVARSNPFLRSGLINSRWLPEVNGQVPPEIDHPDYKLTDFRLHDVSSQAYVAHQRACQPGHEEMDKSDVCTGAEALRRLVLQGNYAPGSVKHIEIP